MNKSRLLSALLIVAAVSAGLFLSLREPKSTTTDPIADTTTTNSIRSENTDTATAQNSSPQSTSSASAAAGAKHVEHPVASRTGEHYLPQNDGFFKHFDQKSVLTVSRDNFAFLDEVALGDSVNLEMGGFNLSGQISGLNVGEDSSVYSIRFNNYSARMVVSVDRRGMFRAFMGFSDEARMLLIESGKTIDGAGLPIEVTTASELLCLPDGEAYPFDFNQQAIPLSGAPTASPSGTLAEAPPALDSDSSSEYVFYLDFDGEEVVNDPFWGSISADPHPRANDVAWVTAVWKRVVEDFIPYNVNVTTDRAVYEAAAEDQRLMVIVTPTDDALPNSGGVAFLSTFGLNSPICWVFNLSEYSAADTISHEIGHTLGLFHDGAPLDEYYGGHGTGPTSWAPIMGAFFSDGAGVSYDERVTQWSKGEYENANNQQDDLAIIAGPGNNGLGYRKDTISNDFNESDPGAPIASLVQLAQLEVSGGGIIERNTDVDIFQFNTNTGTVQLTISGLDVASTAGEDGDNIPGGNLAISATLYDSDQNVVTRSNPSDTLSAFIDVDVIGGTYYLAVEGAGRGASPSVGFSDYASLGQYFISGTIASPALTVLGGPKRETIFSNDVSPSFVDGTNFGFNYPAGGQVIQAFDLKNTSENAITGLSASLVSGAHFTIVSATANIPAGQTGTLTIAFDPSNVGLKDDTVVINYTSDQPETFTFAVQGTSTPGVNTDNYGAKGSYQFTQAANLTAQRDVWISQYKGLAIQSDGADWFSFNVSLADGDVFIVATLEYDPAAGPLTMNLFNSSAGGAPVGVANDDDGTITITYPIPAHAVGQFSKFYLQVLSANSSVVTNNSYDLKWSTLRANTGGDDFYESNNTSTDAFDLTNSGGVSLVDIAGPGIQLDDDWYKITVPRDPRTRFVYANLTYDETASDMTMEIVGPGSIFGGSPSNIPTGLPGDLVLSVFDYVLTEDFAANFSPGGNTIIIGVEPGEYFVRVSGDNNGTEYNLEFLTLEDDRYEVISEDVAGNVTENDLFSNPYDLGGSIINANLVDVDGFGVVAAYSADSDSANFVNVYDDDWYRFSIANSDTAVEQITLDLAQYGGALGFGIYTTNGIPIAVNDTRETSVLINDLDFITLGKRVTVPFPQDTEYLIRVFPLDPIDYITAYDFRISLVSEIAIPDNLPVDNYEENDVFYGGYDLSAEAENTLYSVDGYATLSDPDWYKITIPEGARNLELDLTYITEEGDIQLLLADRLGRVFQESVRFGDSEIITVAELLEGGTYYIGVNGDYVGTTYNLVWSYERAEDNYEPNNSLASAYDLSGNEGRWISKVDGLGIQADDDWFKIQVPIDAKQLEVQTNFSPNQGDIDLEVYTSAGLILARSNTSNSVESILATDIDPGIYYIRVYFGNAGNTYDLRWNAPSQTEINAAIDDNYEENDSIGTSYSLGTADNRNLSTLDGLASQTDDDWYSFVIEENNAGLFFEITFSHAAGDIDLELYNASGSLLGASRSVTNNESISSDTGLPAGIYYARVYGEGLGNTYDLFWRDIHEDIYEENDTLATATDRTEFAGVPLSDVELATQGDDDWYQISVAENNSQLNVVVDFVHSLGNIDIEVYNGSEVLLDSSTGTGDQESLSGVLNAGTYYLRVFGDNAYNDYDLVWNVIVDDAFEENDQSDFSDAATLAVAGEVYDGIQNDDDYFVFNTAVGDNNLEIDLQFLNAEGDLNLTLYNSLGNVLTFKDTTDDNESITFGLSAPVSTTYYLKVSGPSTGTNYTISWTSQTITGDSYEGDDTNNLIGDAFDISEFESNRLSTVSGFATLDDEDWYAFTSTARDVLAVAYFDDAAGNIDIDLFNSSGTRIGSSVSTNDDERIVVIDANAEVGDVYYIRVYGELNGNSYDLVWNSFNDDDSYEENDTGLTSANLADPDPLNNQELLLQSNLTQLDEDWYEVFAEAGDELLTVNLEFVHSEGNIDVDLYYDGDLVTPVASSTTSEDVESITYTIPGGNDGTYYIRVYGDNLANTYSLRWNSTTEDAFEENDDRGTAFDLSGSPRTSLADVTGANGLGVQFDDDWYKVDLSATSSQFLDIGLGFEHDEGDLVLSLYNAAGTLLATSDSSDVDDGFERITYIISTPEEYFILVSGQNTGNDYDLAWRTTLDDVYEQNDIRNTAYNLTGVASTDLSNHLGTAIQNDLDYYRLSIPKNQATLTVDLIFSHKLGNLDLSILDAGGNLIGEFEEVVGQEEADNESVTITLSPAAATYYILVQGPNRLTPYDLSWTISNEDNYEENDDSANSFVLSGFNARPEIDDQVNFTDLLSALGHATQTDDDWYSVDLPAGDVSLSVDLSFIHADGDVNVEIIASNGTTVVGSAASTTNDESLTVNLPDPSGVTYYFRVYGDNVGNSYNLQWSSTDVDAYEVNNFINEAYDLTSNENVSLSNLDGFGSQTSNDDWFIINISNNTNFIFISLNYFEAEDVEGDIDIDLYRLSGATTDTVRKPIFVARANSSSNTSRSEQIIYFIPNVADRGYYAFRVYGANAGNAYNLTWSDGSAAASNEMVAVGDLSYSNLSPQLRPADFDANPDGDIFPNWAEYALGLAEAEYNAQVIGQSIQTIGGKDYYTIEYVRNKEAVARGYSYKVLESAVMDFSGESEAVYVSTEQLPNNMEKLLYRCSLPISEATKCFFKLVVDEPASGY